MNTDNSALLDGLTKHLWSCPFCGSHSIDYGCQETEPGNYKLATCSGCNATGGVQDIKEHKYIYWKRYKRA